MFKCQKGIPLIPYFFIILRYTRINLYIGYFQLLKIGFSCLEDLFSPTRILRMPPENLALIKNQGTEVLELFTMENSKTGEKSQ